MIKYLLIGVALVVAVVLIARWYQNTNPGRLAKGIKWGLIGASGLVAIYLATTGKIHLALAPLALTLLPLILRKFRNASGASQSGSPSPGSQSEVNTEYISMTLDHDTGQMDGTVDHGTYAGQKLSQLSKLNLINLLRELKTKDEQSAQLLETYMDRVLDEDWRIDENLSNGDSSKHNRSGIMSMEEAYNVLGLERNCNETEIRDAHRKLLLKIHPDQGGSDYLASKINQAKEVLLNDK